MPKILVALSRSLTESRRAQGNAGLVFFHSLPFLSQRKLPSVSPSENLIIGRVNPFSTKQIFMSSFLGLWLYRSALVSPCLTCLPSHTCGSEGASWPSTGQDPEATHTPEEDCKMTALAVELQQLKRKPQSKMVWLT